MKFTFSRKSYTFSRRKAESSCLWKTTDEELEELEKLAKEAIERDEGWEVVSVSKVILIKVHKIDRLPFSTQSRLTQKRVKQAKFCWMVNC